jgi:spore coat polysaccharide biosynthesis predicted glycosyltransferase SpsG
MTMKVLFRVAAGPLVGYGHLRRAVSLARALGVRPVVSLRGGAAASDVARRLGCRVVTGSANSVLAAERVAVVIVDMPSGDAARGWVAAARRAGARVVGVADNGIGCVDGDMTIDGGAAATQARRTTDLRGPRYAILDPRLLTARSRRRRANTVFIALGGGSRQRLANRAAAELLHRRPDVRVRIASGFAPTAAMHHEGHEGHDGRSNVARGDARIVHVPAKRSLAHELASCSVAIVGGGVTLYEACALGTPTVGLPVVRAQRTAIDACAARGAIVAARARTGVQTARAAAGLALGLLDSPSSRRRLSAAGRQLVDGLGAARIARLVTQRTGRRP